MKMAIRFTFILLSVCAALGCAQKSTSPPNPLTFQRGQQLLAAGSPKSAIPLLTQTIASMPDGPEPVALLALAYALDLQHERAIVQARQVRRADGSKPAWERVAIGIAQMGVHRPAEAAAVLQRVVAEEPAGSALSQAGGQWLTMSLVLNQEHDKALAVIKSLGRHPQMQTTALLWVIVLETEQGHTQAAGDALLQCAKVATNESGKRALTQDLASADDQTRYDAAVAAVAIGDLETAQKLFEIISISSPLESDALVWIALVSGVKRDWQACRSNLKEACEKGSNESRGLANQLFSLVCAIEDRPDDMIESMLTGQRLLGRNTTPAYIVDQPKPESVWFSDSMK